MTNAMVKALIASVKVNMDTDITGYQASVYIGAREILNQDPDDENAIATISAYHKIFRTGKEIVCWEQFLLPIPYTVEELQESARLDAEYIAWLESKQRRKEFNYAVKYR